MLQKIYLGVAGFMVAGYLGWSVMGMELGGLGKDPVPTVPRVSSSSSSSGYSSSSRSGGGFFSSGGGFGK